MGGMGLDVRLSVWDRWRLGRRAETGPHPGVRRRWSRRTRNDLFWDSSGCLQDLQDLGDRLRGVGFRSQIHGVLVGGIQHQVEDPTCEELGISGLERVLTFETLCQCR